MNPKRFDILTLFPQALEPYLQSSLLGKASEKGLLQFRLHQLRDWAQDKHRRVDDEVYGGGQGMVLKPEPIVAALEQLRQPQIKNRVLYLSPQGRPLTQKVAEELLAYDQLLLLCGRYEGVDQRVLDHWVDEEISLGDFILCGGELAALSVVETVSRLVPGVVGKEESLKDESFTQGLLEYPHYTRPQNFRGHEVPEILLSGHHGEVDTWRRDQSLAQTRQKRPDLLNTQALATKAQPKTKPKIKAPLYLALIHYPVTNAHGQVVCTSITPFDLHDIARMAKTFGLCKYFVVCPVESQQALAQKIMNHWLTGVGGQLNETRKQAFESVELVNTLDEARLTIEKELGKTPRLVATSAKAGPGRTSFTQLQKDLSQTDTPHLLLFGTGWGMTEELLDQTQIFLEPIAGGGDGSYNHLSVRSAVAITLDRLWN